MTTLYQYHYEKTDGLRTYEYHTEFGWINVQVYPDGSNTIQCEDSSYQEIREAIQEIEIGIKFYGIQLK
jgi:hypothetical protein